MKKLSQNATYKNGEFEGNLLLKFSGNTKVTDKAQLTATGIDKYNKTALTSFVTGSGLKTEYDIVAKEITADNVHPYNATTYSSLWSAHGDKEAGGSAGSDETWHVGDFVYTAEDVQKKDPVPAKGYTTKFNLYQIRQDGVVNVKKAIPAANYDITWKEATATNAVSLNGTLIPKAQGKTENYKMATGLKSHPITGVWLYDNKAQLAVKDLEIYDQKDDGTTARFLQLNKNNLEYTYSGLQVEILESIKTATIKTNKEQITVDDATAASSSNVKKTAAEAFEIISLTPQSPAVNEGSYKVVLRVRPDVVKGNASGDKSYGGTVTLSFKVKAMDGKLKL